MMTAANRMHRAIGLALMCAALQGCSSFQLLENRIACSTDLAELFFVSRYGTIGISADVSPKDAKRTCEALLLLQMLERQPSDQGQAASKPRGV